MKSNINCGLKGAFKVDLFKEGKFIESTDWFDNTITNTGVYYPYIFPFAQCFMRLCLGSNNAMSNPTGAVSLLSAGATPIYNFTVYDPTFTGNASQPYATGYYQHTGQYLGWEAYEIGGPHNTNYQGGTSACGTLFTNQGLNFYRAWTIPTGVWENGAYVAQNLNIGSFMVSPTDTSNITGSGAFSIVSRNVTIPSGFTATITYQLSLNFQNYQEYTYFSGISGGNGYFNTTQAYLANNEEGTLVSGWNNLSGIYSMIIPGLQVIGALGECVIPPWGDDMEPLYSSNQNLYFYLSPDMSQFSVSPYGQNLISESGAYNANGLMGNYTEWATTIGNADLLLTVANFSWPSFPNDYYYSGINDPNSSQVLQSIVNNSNIPSNTRLNKLLPISNYSGVTTNFAYNVNGFISPILSKTPIAFATPGASGFDLINYANYGQAAVISTYCQTLPYVPTNSRSNSVSKRAQFSPIQSKGWNTRYGTLTLAHQTQAGTISQASFVPYVDFLFFDTYGRAGDMNHYRIIPDIYLYDRGSGIAQVMFSITGVSGAQFPSINRLYNAYGFMGPGVQATFSNPSGLDFNGSPMLNTNLPSPYNQFSSGYTFPGQVLNTGVTGNDSYNNGVGWGAVYGIIANSSFYAYPADVCLIKNSPWNGTGYLGYSGDYGVGTYPNPTGDNRFLYWPLTNNINSPLGLSISNLGYLLCGYGVLYDTGSYFITGNYQMINNIIYTGFALTQTDAPYTSLYPYTGQNPSNQGGGDTLIYFSGSSSANVPLQVSDLGSLALSLSFTLNGTGYSLPIVTGVNNNINSNYVQFSGFKMTPFTGLGYLKDWIPNWINNATVNPIVGNSGGLGNIYLCYDDNGTYYPLNTSGFSLIASQFKQPSGAIHHVENYTGYGNRLLPNYGVPNNIPQDYYLPVTGGSFPGMSMNNGMQLFFTFNWSGQ